MGNLFENIGRAYYENLNEGFKNIASAYDDSDASFGDRLMSQAIGMAQIKYRKKIAIAIGILETFLS